MATGGLAALVIKVHHACVDGVRGVQLYDVLFDLTPDAPLERAVGVVRSSVGVPSGAALWCATASGIVGAPLRTSRALRAIAGAGIGFAGFMRSRERRYVTLPFEAPRSRFNGPLTPSRAVAFSSMPIDEVRTVRKAHGVTFNDVVLAACAYTQTTPAAMAPQTPTTCRKMRKSASGAIVPSSTRGKA